MDGGAGGRPALGAPLTAARPVIPAAAAGGDEARAPGHERALGLAGPWDAPVLLGRAPGGDQAAITVVPAVGAEARATAAVSGSATRA